MKLHKLMYFAQRESYVLYDEPLFDGTFYGWKYGPILKEVRSFYKEKSLDFNGKLPEKYVNIMDRIFARYADKSSWSLSRLTHGELSWKNSRIGIDEAANSDYPISNDDIITDAARIKARLKAFS
jgi:uncharacterized phage-associated protein